MICAILIYGTVIGKCVIQEESADAGVAELFRHGISGKRQIVLCCPGVKIISVYKLVSCNQHVQSGNAVYFIAVTV